MCRLRGGCSYSNSDGSRIIQDSPHLQFCLGNQEVNSLRAYNCMNRTACFYRSNNNVDQVRSDKQKRSIWDTFRLRFRLKVQFQIQVRELIMDVWDITITKKPIFRTAAPNIAHLSSNAPLVRRKAQKMVVWVCFWRGKSKIAPLVMTSFNNRELTVAT